VATYWQPDQENTEWFEFSPDLSNDTLVWESHVSQICRYVLTKDEHHPLNNGFVTAPLSEFGQHGFFCQAPELHLIIRREPQNVPRQTIKCISSISGKVIWQHDSPLDVRSTAFLALLYSYDFSDRKSLEG